MSNAIRSDIFPMNVSRMEREFPLPNVNDRIDDTPQLVYGARLLAKTTEPLLTMSLSQLGWIQAIDDLPAERKRIEQLVTHMMSNFISLPTKDCDSIREISLFGAIVSNDDYRRLLDCFFDELDLGNPLSVELLQGLAQLIEDAPSSYVQDEDLLRCLRVIQSRLDDRDGQSQDRLIRLLTVLKEFLGLSIAQYDYRDHKREHELQTLLNVLAVPMTNKDPLLRYQAHYAFHASLYAKEGKFLYDGSAQYLKETVGDMRKNKISSENVNEISRDLPASIKDEFESSNDLKQPIAATLKDLEVTFKDSWYRAILFAENLIRKGRFSLLNAFVAQPRCHQDPMFRWGFCQLLGEVSVDPCWEETIRHQALEFLEEMFYAGAGSKKYQDTRRWIVTILKSVAALPAIDFFSGVNNEAVKRQSSILARSLENEADPFEYPCPLNIRPLFPDSSRLLKNANDALELDVHLEQIRSIRLERYDSSAVYVPLLSMSKVQASETFAIPLQQRVDEFLASNQEVLLILGDSGAGKSTFGARLEQQLWAQYSPGSPIPLFVSLPAVMHSESAIIHQYLDTYNLFSAAQVEELKRTRQFILICDGYDEWHRWSNLHTANRLNRPNQWQAKLIIFCREDYLVPEYRPYFEPQSECLEGQSASSDSSLLEEVVIVPFQADQIREYIDQYRIADGTQDNFGEAPVWTTRHYMEKLDAASNLKDLIKNPFLLKLSLDTLPKMAPTVSKMSRVELYDAFVNHHFENELVRLSNQKRNEKMSLVELSEFEMIEQEFVILAREFSRHLSESIFKELGGVNAVEYTSTIDSKSWKVEFFGDHPKSKLLRESSLLMQHSGAASRSRPGSRNRLNRNGNQPDFENQLRDIIQLSKTDPSVSRAAANAITILVRAGVAFNGADLRAIQIAGADLTGGQFDSAQLHKANLTGVNLTGAHLHRTDLTEARMDGAVFGKKDLLEATGLTCCTSSPDGSLLAVGFAGGEVVLYSVANWKRLHTFHGHTVPVLSLTFNSTGSLFASGGRDNAVCVWKVDGSDPCRILKSHSGWVNAVAFSPDGKLVSASKDMTIRLWLENSTEPASILTGHTNEVTSATWSSKGTEVASGSSDGTIRLWDMETGTLARILSYGLANVCSIAYSIEGDRLVVSAGRELRIWDLHRNDDAFVLQGHKEPVTCVAFSQDGRWIASSSMDQSVRLWNAETGFLTRVLTGHSWLVQSVAFLSDGQVASGGSDGTLRLWDISHETSTNENASSDKSLVVMQQKALISIQSAQIHSYIHAVMTKNYEIHDCPIPRLFVVVPQNPDRWNNKNPLSNKFRLHFLCECGVPSNSGCQSTMIPNKTHLANHEGYQIERQTEFFRKFGPYVLTILKMLKYGVIVANMVAPGLTRLVHSVTPAVTSNALIKQKSQIGSWIDQAIDQVERIQKDYARVARAGHSNKSSDFDDIELLEGADLRHLASFLRDQPSDRAVGNLYRSTTQTGQVKWVCKEHFREDHQEKDEMAFKEEVEAANGTFDENKGRVEVQFLSKASARRFYVMMSKTTCIQELKIGLLWDLNPNDMTELMEALKKSRVAILELNCQHSAGPRIEMLDRSEWDASWWTNYRPLKLSRANAVFSQINGTAGALSTIKVLHFEGFMFPSAKDQSSIFQTLIATCTGLRNLTVGCGVCDSGKMIPEFKSIQSMLNKSNVEIFEMAYKYGNRLLSTPPHTTQSTTLDLVGNDFNNAQSLLVEYGRGLESMNLYNVDDESMTTLQRHLGTKVRSVRLEKTRLSWCGLQVLQSLVRRSERFTDLVLGIDQSRFGHTAEYPGSLSAFAMLARQQTFTIELSDMSMRFVPPKENNLSNAVEENLCYEDRTALFHAHGSQLESFLPPDEDDLLDESAMEALAESTAYGSSLKQLYWMPKDVSAISDSYLQNLTRVVAQSELQTLKLKLDGVRCRCVLDAVQWFHLRDLILYEPDHSSVVLQNLWDLMTDSEVEEGYKEEEEDTVVVDLDYFHYAGLSSPEQQKSLNRVLSKLVLKRFDLVMALTVKETVAMVEMMDCSRLEYTFLWTEGWDRYHVQILLDVLLARAPHLATVVLYRGRFTKEQVNQMYHRGIRLLENH
ncbi:hypothetical protein BGZ83_007942 [Gryganskiella cystojenkinii]|nr:hypothetical protein BGZ83_007942 [Gryganskiella cystojenkinii]